MWKNSLKRIAIALAASVAALSSSQEVKATNFTLVASGLDGQRGLTFGADGALYSKHSLTHKVT